MYRDGPHGVALCEPCHSAWMEIWRREDALSEAEEFIEHGRAA